MFRAARARLQRWHGGPFDWIGCIEGKHGDHRLHVHLVLRDEDFSPAEVRHLWTAGKVDDEPVLLREGGYRRLAQYFNKERPDGFEMCIRDSTTQRIKNLAQYILENAVTLDDCRQPCADMTQLLADGHRIDAWTRCV